MLYFCGKLELACAGPVALMPSCCILLHWGMLASVVLSLSSEQPATSAYPVTWLAAGTLVFAGCCNAGLFSVCCSLT